LDRAQRFEQQKVRLGIGQRRGLFFQHPENTVFAIAVFAVDFSDRTERTGNQRFRAAGLARQFDGGLVDDSDLIAEAEP